MLQGASILSQTTKYQGLVVVAKQPISAAAIVRRVLPHLLPHDSVSVRYRLVTALLLLLVAKLTEIALPQINCRTVDTLS